VKLSRVVFAVFVLAGCAPAQSAVATAQYDNARTGANLHETILTPRNVASPQFGRILSYQVDGDVYAQPLYVPRLAIPGKGVRDVVFVATERDAVYAFDAVEPGPPLWSVSFLNPAAGVNTVRWSDVQCSFIGPDIGITATPVIDVPARTLYLIARTSARQRGGEVLFFQRLHALDLATGTERPGSPVLIRASAPGSAYFGLVNRNVTFNALVENSRAALLLVNGTIYIAWGSSCDVGLYYGWVLAYDARTLRQTGVFNTAPDAGESGIWQSNAGIAADGEGSVYAVTGNGKFTAAKPRGRDYGDSILKLGFDKSALAVRDFFTPFDESRLNRRDDDLGSTGPVLVPDQPGAHPHLLVVAGKTGRAYLIDRDRMGRYRPDADTNAVQTFDVGSAGVFGAPADWNGHLYFYPSGSVLEDYPFINGRVAPAPAHTGQFKARNPGAIPSMSANGTRDGIVWVVQTKDYRAKDTPAILQAYDAADVSCLLYSTEHDGRNTPGLAIRFTTPVVANGRVYVGSRNAVYVYGLGNAAKHTR